MNFQGSYGHCAHFTERLPLLLVSGKVLCLPTLVDGHVAGSFGGHRRSETLLMRRSWISPGGGQSRS